MMRRTLLLLTMLSSFASVARADQWTVPTKEELSMTAQPEVPGAPAVYLFREETSEDALHMWSIYVRLKVLTDEGKRYGDVAIHFAKGQEGVGYSVGDIAGRTIQPDGTIVPFTGKPYEKMIQKGKDVQYMSKVFSLPAVQVGSILEYRYKLRWDDYYFKSPNWYPQEELFTRKAHYLWKPTSHQLISTANGHEMLTDTIAWAPVLPPGPTVKSTTLPTGQQVYELTMTDVKPQPQERYMPPIGNYSYRVYFYYTAYRTAEEYWKQEGRFWSKQREKFIGSGPGVRAAVEKIVSPGDTQDQKSRKIYAAIMKMENTSFSRRRMKAEQRAEIKTTDDLVKAERASSDEMADLFVAMCRAAGLKAYVAAVTDRSHRTFMKGYLSFYQLDDRIAIVNIDGKDVFLDPGARYMPYGHLAWEHTLTVGLRQTEGGNTLLMEMPGEPFSFSKTARVADLKLDEQGMAKGTVRVTFNGEPALRWRHAALRGDETSVKDDLRKWLEEMLPGGMDIVVDNVENVASYEEPLKVNFTVSGAIGKATSSRLIVPSDIFLATAKPAFTSEQRESMVYFPYTELVQDAERIIYPATFTLEASPKVSKELYERRIGYERSSKTAANSVTVFRNFTRGDMLFEAKEYPQLRSFYSKMESADQEPIVLKTAGHASVQEGAATSAAAGN